MDQTNLKAGVEAAIAAHAALGDALRSAAIDGTALPEPCAWRDPAAFLTDVTEGDGATRLRDSIDACRAQAERIAEMIARGEGRRALEALEAGSFARLARALAEERHRLDPDA